MASFHANFLTITAPFMAFQTAVLHMTCYGQSLYSPSHPSQSKADSPWFIGERQIRVITLALPVTINLSEVFASADQVTIATLLANKAIERSLTHKLKDARDAVLQKVVDMLQ